MTDPRKPVFDAIKTARGGKAFDQMEVGAIDNLLDALGVPREGAGFALGELSDKPAFYAAAREITGSLDQVQVDSIEAILKRMAASPIQHVAYVLATAWHEARFKPQEEWGKGKGRPYAKPGKYGQSQHGRGLVQTTWDRNYEWLDKAASDAGLIAKGALLKDFSLALRPDIAVLALVKGMQEAAFASNGKPLSHYGPKADGTFDYLHARQTVNVMDKASQIAGYAERFEAALRKGLA